MNTLYVMLMINLTVPYPGDTDVGQVAGASFDASEQFDSLGVCLQESTLRSSNPRIVRNVGRGTVTRTVYTYTPFDPNAFAMDGPVPDDL